MYYYWSALRRITGPGTEKLLINQTFASDSPGEACSTPSKKSTRRYLAGLAEPYEMLGMKQA